MVKDDFWYYSSCDGFYLFTTVFLMFFLQYETGEIDWETLTNKMRDQYLLAILKIANLAE